MRFRPPFAGAIAGLVALLAGCGGDGAEPPRPVVRDVPAVTHVAPDGDDGAPCTRQRPCQTLSQALRATSTGGKVLLLAGDYGDVKLRGDGGPRGVVIAPARGARVHLGEMAITARHVELRDLRLTGWHANPGAADLTFRRVRSAWFYVNSVSTIRILGGSVGPADSVDPQIRASDTAGAPVPRDILIDGVEFHGFTRRDVPDAHVECLQIGAGEKIVVRHSRFERCATNGIFARSWGGTAVLRDLVFEDNAFGPVPEGFYALRVVAEPGTENVRVRRNVAANSLRVDPGISGVSFVGNTAPRGSWECIADQRYADNTWAGAACGPTDTLAAGAADSGA
jgi:hypothetical protein